jgi:hypothetical protein
MVGVTTILKIILKGHSIRKAENHCSKRKIPVLMDKTQYTSCVLFSNNSKKEQSVHILVFVLLEFHVFCKFCSQSAIGWNTGPPMEELEKVSKELKGSATL